MNETLEQVMDLCNKAIREAQHHKHKINDAINWGDLHCHTVERYETDSGEKGFRCYVSEAAPDSMQLINFIMQYFNDYGVWNVEIITEW